METMALFRKLRAVGLIIGSTMANVPRSSAEVVDLISAHGVGEAFEATQLEYYHQLGKGSLPN